MKNNKINSLLITSIISICTANLINASEKTDITYDVIGTNQSAFGEAKGYVIQKSATGSKMDVDVKEIPQSVVVISKDMMNDRQVENIQSVTNYAASVSQPYGDADTRTNYGNIRGLGSIYRSSFLDGTKLLYGGHLIPKIDPYALERVEILKGPASVLYGSSGPGGLLSLQSKVPNGTEEKEIGISYASHNNKTIFADLNHNINKEIQIRLTGKLKKGDNELDKSTSNSYFFNPSLKYYINDDSTLEFIASFAKDETKGLGMAFSGARTKLSYHNNIAENADKISNTFFGGINPTFVQNLQNSANSVNALNLSDDFFIGLSDKEVFSKSHQSFTTTYKNNINDKLKLNSTIRLMKMDGDYNFSQASKTGLSTTIATQNLAKVPLEYLEIASSLKTVAMDNNLQYNFKNNEIDNTSLFGIDLQYTDYSTKRTTPVGYFFDLNNPKTALNVNASSRYFQDYDQSIVQVGAYAQNHLKIKDSWIVSTSLRYDKLKQVDDNHLTDEKTTQKDDSVSARVGLSYLFKNGITPYASYSTSFTSNIGSGFNGSNFKPSVGKQVELGLKYAPTNFDALFTLATFKLEEQDRVSADPSHSGFDIQQGDAEVKGVEFDAVMSPFENNNVIFSFSKLDAKETNMANPIYEGRELGGIPKYTVALWSDYTFKGTVIGDLKFGAGYKYVGETKSLHPDYFDFPSQPQRLYEDDSYSVVDALISSQYKQWNVALNAYNLMDKEIHLGENAITNYISNGRTFKLTVSYKF